MSISNVSKTIVYMHITIFLQKLRIHSYSNRLIYKELKKCYEESFFKQEEVRHEI